MGPCWAVILQFDSPLSFEYDGAFVNGSRLSWIARNNSKPGRSNAEVWVLHASAEWSATHLERHPDDVAADLTSEFWRLNNHEPRLASKVTCHRWRYAIPRNVLEARFLFDHEIQLGAAGDWCGGPRVEGAFLSGLAVATHLTELL